ncbi:MAG: hypothetical protein ACRDIV_06960 [Ktedonobacteraceae bacterium]
MEKQDILDILDSLDLQISMGKIDQATYNDLRQKWVQKLQVLEASVAAGATGSLAGSSGRSTSGQFAGFSSSAPPSPPAIEVLACPMCAAPADIHGIQDLTRPIECPHCCTVYTFRQSQDNAQHLKQELKAWLDQMIVGSGYNGAGGSSSIDANARRFIFTESLYPALKKDIDRHLEDLEYAPEAPMVQLKVLVGFEEYQPGSQLLAIGRGENQWLKTLTTRVSAPQLQDFAVTQDDKLKMLQLQFRVMSLIYYANIANHLTAATVASYQAIHQNLQALQKDYREHAQNVVDEGYRSYIVALDARITGAMLLLDLLIATFEKGRGVAPEAVLAQLDRAIAQLTQSEQQALACMYNPLYTVPLQQGIQKDLMVARIFQAIIKCYEVATRLQSVDFEPFYEDLMSYAATLGSNQTTHQLLGLIQSISRLLSARAGDEPLPVLVDWSWIEGTIEANRYKPTFGAAETVGTVGYHFHPYWVATLNYAEKSGIIFKSGTGREALILVDATTTNSPIVGHILVSDPLLPVIQQATHTFNFLDKRVMALPALLSQDMAERTMKSYANQHTRELGATIVKMIGLLYLPTAFVRYAGKNGSREMVIGRLNFVNKNLTGALLQTQQFLQKYGA